MAACSSCDNTRVSSEETEVVASENAPDQGLADAVEDQRDRENEKGLPTSSTVETPQREEPAERKDPPKPKKKPAKKANRPVPAPEPKPRPVEPPQEVRTNSPVESKAPEPPRPPAPVMDAEVVESPPEQVEAERSPAEVVVAPSPPRRVAHSDAGQQPVLLTGRPAPAAPKKVTLPAGSVIEVRTVDRISSKDQVSGDLFEATLNRGIEFDGSEIIPRGSRVTGRLLEVLRAGKVKGRAEVTFDLREISDGEKTYEVQTNPITIEAESSKGRDAAKVGAATAIGAVLGAVFGGKKGAAIGGAAGGGASTAGVLLTRGKDVEIPAERLFSFRLERDLILEVQ